MQKKNENACLLWMCTKLPSYFTGTTGTPLKINNLKQLIQNPNWQEADQYKAWWSWVQDYRKQIQLVVAWFSDGPRSLALTPSSPRLS